MLAVAEAPVPPAGGASPWPLRAERYLRDEHAYTDEELAELMRKLVGLRQMPLALRVAEKRLASGPPSPAILHRKGLALSRMGALLQARALAERVLGERGVEPRWRAECYGLAGRVSKVLDRMATELGEESSHRQLAFQSYLDGFREFRESNPEEVDAAYLGINAATLALLLRGGDTLRVNELAVAAQERCEAEMSARASAGDPDPWHLAILAEAALLRGDRTTAEQRFAEATAGMTGRWGDLASMRMNARLIVGHFDSGSTTWADERIRIPRVGMFAGHMVDSPSRARPRFPADMEGYVRERLTELIEREDIGFAHASAAAGGDILFHECVNARVVAPGQHGVNRVVLPFEREAFRSASVEFGAAGNWGARFDSIINAHDTITRHATREREADDPVYFGFAQRLVTGFAALEAREFGDRPVAVTLWDERAGDGAYGTASAVGAWRRAGYTVYNIYPVGRLFPGSSPMSVPPSAGVQPAPPANRWRSDPHGEIASIVSVSVRMPTDATEREAGQMIAWLLEATASPRDRLAANPPHVRTREDGVDFVCRSARDAARLGLDIHGALRAIQTGPQDSGEPGLAQVFLRSALVFPAEDPSTGARTFMGGHTVDLTPAQKAVPADFVLCSEAFAASAAADDVKGLAWEPVGLPEAIRTAHGEGLYCLGHPLAHPVDWSRRFASAEVEQRLRNIRVPVPRAGVIAERVVDAPHPNALLDAARGHVLPDALSRTLAILTRALRIDALTIWLPTADREWLVPHEGDPSAAATGFSQAERARRGVLGLVLSSGSMIRWNVDSSSPSELPTSLRALRAFMAVPVCIAGQPYGVLSFARMAGHQGAPSESEAFTDDDEVIALDAAELVELHLHGITRE